MRQTTIRMDQLFKPEQLRDAARIIREKENSRSMAHEDLVRMLEPDSERFRRMQMELGYAAYILEWKREEVLKWYGA